MRACLFDPPATTERPSSLEHPRPALIICPGGGYEFLSQREADPVAVAFQRHGFNTFVLDYSIREHSGNLNPAIDAARAVRWVRSNSAELGIAPDQVAVMGFSAGGHVAATLGTHWNTPELLAAEEAEYAELVAQGLDENRNLMHHSSRPDAIVPCYSLFNGDWGPAAAELKAPPETDCIAAVTDQTPPAFVWTTGEDQVVPPTQSLKFVTALAKHGVDFEYHHFAHGVHGLSTADPSANADRAELPENAHFWVDMCANWLRATFENH